MEYLGRLFANTSVAPSDDNDLPGQVRDVVDGELGLWGKITVNKNRFERPSKYAEGGEEARAGHV